MEQKEAKMPQMPDQFAYGFEKFPEISSNNWFRCQKKRNETKKLLFRPLSYAFPVFAGFIIGGVGGFGVTAGAHRYWCHKAYKANLPLRIILMLCYVTAGQVCLCKIC